MLNEKKKYEKVKKCKFYKFSDYIKKREELQKIEYESIYTLKTYFEAIKVKAEENMNVSKKYIEDLLSFYVINELDHSYYIEEWIEDVIKYMKEEGFHCIKSKNGKNYIFKKRLYTNEKVYQDFEYVRNDDYRKDFCKMIWDIKRNHMITKDKVEYIMKKAKIPEDDKNFFISEFLIFLDVENNFTFTSTTEDEIWYFDLYNPNPTEN